MSEKIYRNKTIDPEGFPEAVSMDDVEEGTTYGKVKSENISDGSIKASGVDGLGLLAELNMVTVNELLDGCVTELKIAASAVTNSKIAVDAIQGAVIAAGAITENKIYTGAVTTDKIFANAITAAKIAANTITASQIAAGTITATQIAAGTITATQIAASTITSDKINVSTLSAISANIGTVTAGSITGVTITGGIIRTATSGKRVELNSTGNLNEIALYNADGTLSGKFYGAGSEIQGGPWLFLTAKTYIDGQVLITGGLSLHGSGDQTMYLRTATATPSWIIAYSASPYNVQINRSWLPYPTNACDLGSATYNWKNIYLTGNIIVGGTVDGIDISSHAGAVSAHHSSTSNALAITPASYVGGAIICNSGSIDQADTGGRTRQYLCGLRSRTEPGVPAAGEVYLYYNSGNNNLEVKFSNGAIFILANN